jgi:hypothetical protein
MFVVTVLVVVTLVGLSVLLHSRRVQGSQLYHATVAPLANTTDIGFVATTPIGRLDAPLTMLGLCRRQSGVVGRARQAVAGSGGDHARRSGDDRGRGVGISS